LPRAQDFGDERTVNQLTAMSRKPVGCRKTSRRTCKARCAEEARAFIETARKIYARLATKKAP
jgi:hypothetical protein